METRNLEIGLPNFNLRHIHPLVLLLNFADSDYQRNLRWLVQESSARRAQRKYYAHINLRRGLRHKQRLLFEVVLN